MFLCKKNAYIYIEWQLVIFEKIITLQEMHLKQILKLIIHMPLPQMKIINIMEIWTKDFSVYNNTAYILKFQFIKNLNTFCILQNYYFSKIFINKICSKDIHCNDPCILLIVL